jgi:hypothetical protein
MDRQSAEIALSNMGYKHPDNNTTKSEYKKYIGDNKNPYTSCLENNDYKTKILAYETNTKDNKISKNSSVDRFGKCPVCFERAEFRCTCKEFREVRCKNNHYWFMKNDKIIVGDPHNVIR